MTAKHTRGHAPPRAALWPKHGVLWPLEAVATLLVYLLLSALPVAWASGLFGGLARALGPRLGMSNRARRNIALALPEKTPAEVEAILRGTWDNLGRTARPYACPRRLRDHRPAAPAPAGVSPREPARARRQTPRRAAARPSAPRSG